KLFDLGAAFPHVEREGSGLLDRVVVAPGVLAQPAQQLELPRDLRRRTDVAGVAMAGDQRQSPLLTAASDQDRRVRPAQRLGRVEGTFQPDTPTFEWLLAAVLALPHRKASLD